MTEAVEFQSIEELQENSRVCCIGDETLFNLPVSCQATFLQALDLRDTKVSDACFDLVLGVCQQPFTAAILKHIQRVLKPSGRVVLKVLSGESAFQALLFSGFTNIQTNGNEFCGTKPSYSTSPISLNDKPKASDVWKISTAEDNPFAADDNPFSMEEDNPFAASENMEDVQMVDMDELLANETQPVEIKDTQMDCGTGSGRKKACKNCSCGLKEQLDGENGVSEGAAPPKSACGSCHLGDAFRCASCPYLGKPAFKEGEVVKLT